MRVQVITPPAVAAVAPEDVWNHLRALMVTSDESPSTDEPLDKANIESLIEAAVVLLDGPDGKLGRALITQELELIMDRFPARIIELPLPPVQSVASVIYISPAGDEKTISPEHWSVFGLGASAGARVVPSPNRLWPTTFPEPDAVRIRYTAGYGDAPGDVPAPIRHALKLLVAHWSENREAVTFANSSRELPLGFMDAISSYRVW